MDNKEQKRPTGGGGTGNPRRRSGKKRTAPEVTYTQPGPFNRNRFLLRLATVVAVVLALLFGMSIFFKVDRVEITFKVDSVDIAGSNKYTAADVDQASGIQNGENLLTLNEAKISSNILSRLPYVDTVRIGIKLPGTVQIEITELDVVYAVEVSDGSWALLRADGRAVEQITAADAERYTRILGFVVEPVTVGQSVQPVQPPAEVTPEGTVLPVTVDSTRQLETAVAILQSLEENGIIGDISTVNVENPGDLELWYADRFQIQLGDSSQLSYKLSLVKATIENHLESYDSGILDASMTIQPDENKEYQIIYTPFN